MNFHKQRKESSIYNIRKFHNWVKRELISQTRKLVDDKNVKLLDLAVGKAGDLNKWIDSNIHNVVGFDIDKDSIYGDKGAIHRYKIMLKSNRKDRLNYKFYVADLSKRESVDFVMDKTSGDKFDIVSCQFAVHYFFKNEETLNTFFTIVKNSIKDNGYFIVTTMNGDMIDETTKTKQKIGNDLFTIEKYKDGNTYKVDLGKDEDTDHYFADKASVEYLVKQDEVKRICDKFGMTFVGITEFSDWYDRYIKENPGSKLSDEEKEFSFLNMSFIISAKH